MNRTVIVHAYILVLISWLMRAFYYISDWIDLVIHPPRIRDLKRFGLKNTTHVQLLTGVHHVIAQAIRTKI